MEPHKDMDGNILKEGDYVVKEGNEEVTFYNTVVGSPNADSYSTTEPFKGIVNEIDRTPGMSEFMSIRILDPTIFTDFEVPVGKNYPENSNIQLRKVNRDGTQALIPGGGRRKQRKKRTKKKSRKKKRKTLKKKRKRRKKKRKTRR